MFRLISLFFVLFVFGVHAAELVPLKDLARHEAYKDVKISPDGEYLAATAVVRNKTVLSLIHLNDLKGTNLRPLDRDDVVNFWWVGSRRVVFTVTQRIFGLDGVFANGELYSIDADGGNKKVIYSWRNSKGSEGFAQVAGRLAASGNLFVNVRPPGGCDRNHGPYPMAESLDAGASMTVLATAPLCGADFVADNHDVVRFAFATDEDQFQKVFYRDSAVQPWRLLFDDATGHVRYVPQRFNRDDNEVYFTCPGQNGVGGICRWDIKTQQMSTVWSGVDAGPELLDSTFDERDAFAVHSLPGRPAVSLLDKNAVESQLLKTLLQEFPGQQVRLGDHSADGKKVIVHVSSDTNPGAFYLYDLSARKLSFLLASRPWIKQEQLAAQEPVDFEARDGMKLHGYLTRMSQTAASKNLPLVLFVHGGPYEIRDRWGFDPYVQALATRGYAVLRVNFRGSGGYGDAFVKAGLREWGGKMQDDITDATHWAIDKGIADPGRICIFGASYGGYAALEGVVKEPDLYRCAIGYVGVYDLRMMYSQGDIPVTRFGKNYLKMALGEDKQQLAERSPVSHADKIKANVMLIAGGADDRVPDMHARDMQAQLKSHGANPEWLYDRAEGHGFYQEEHVTELFERLLAFLDRNIGVGAAAAARK
jgi:dipeptidyl aminopeptidase/acylaminoacyl peptidase